jgi:tRNA (mo5U34)-methyltransferase
MVPEWMPPGKQVIGDGDLARRQHVVLALTRWLRNRKDTTKAEVASLPVNPSCNQEPCSLVEAPSPELATLTDLFTQGEQARNSGDRDAALRLYREALPLGDAVLLETAVSADRCRSASNTYAQLGHVLRDLGDPENAEIAFQLAVKIDNSFDLPHYFLGLLLQRSSQRERAAVAYFEGLKLTGSQILHQALEDLDYSPVEIGEALAAGLLPKAPAVVDDPDFVPRPIEGLADKVKSHYWFHSINLGQGIVTPGIKTRAEIAQEAKAIFDLVSVEGRSVVDIGAWNGGFTVEAKRRGAGRLLAVDDYAWTHSDLRGKETFDLVMSRLGIDVETKQMDVVEVSAENIGCWQVTLFLGVFYHLVDPIAALRRLAEITEEVLILETHLELRDLSTPAMAFFPERELNGDPTNWWAPNAPAIEAMLKVFGFGKVLTTSNPVSHGIRGIFHAFKTEAIYQEHMYRIAQHQHQQAAL